MCTDTRCRTPPPSGWDSFTLSVWSGCAIRTKQAKSSGCPNPLGSTAKQSWPPFQVISDTEKTMAKLSVFAISKAPGVFQTTCRRTAVCCRCGKGGHAGKDCKADPSCLNYHGPHAADSKECPKWKEEEAIQRYETQHGATFARAGAAIVVELDPNIKRRTYAKATSVGTKIAQTAPPKGSGRVNFTVKAQGEKSHKTDSPVRKAAESKVKWICRGLRANYPELQRIKSVFNSNDRAATPTAAQRSSEMSRHKQLQILSPENDSCSFLHVTSVHWSSPGTGGASNCAPPESASPGALPCHLCVVHQQNVTVWRVSGALPRLSFKQVRKINVRPVPQGCLWHPSNDILCLLSRHQCSFYFKHDENKASYAFPALESGKISCGCWSPDGTKLILGIGTALLIYRWEDVGQSISDFSAAAWRIPGLEGQLTSISPVLKDSVVVATEMSLETLCRQDLFTVPDIRSSPSADGIIRPDTSASPSEALFNLRRNEQAPGANASSLVLIHLHDSGDPSKLTSVPLKGVVTPDILLYEKSSQCVVVGSNTQRQIHIYAVLDKHLAYCGDVTYTPITPTKSSALLGTILGKIDVVDIADRKLSPMSVCRGQQLEKGQRPKGLCSMPAAAGTNGSALLILVGQKELDESALLMPTTEADFRLSLKYIILKSGAVVLGDGAKKGLPSLVKSESMREAGGPAHQTGVRRERSGSVKNELAGFVRGLSPISQSEHDSPADLELHLSRPELRPTDHTSKMIEELPGGSLPSANSDDIQTDFMKFSSQAPSFNNEKLASAYELRRPQHSSSASGLQRDRHNGEPSPQENRQVEKERTPGLISKSSKETSGSPSVSDQSSPSQADLCGSAEAQEATSSAGERGFPSGRESTVSTPDSGVALNASPGCGQTPSPRPGSTPASPRSDKLGADGGAANVGADAGFASVERQVQTQETSQLRLSLVCEAALDRERWRRMTAHLGDGTAQ
ncbi:hypothetical protein EGW08_001841 [Elysia chlorotica]|uniref:WD repeat and coiled-coil-containing protein n=1 Tax=Elysia chlorotica TaxID=188477 RepID=A0A3S1A4F2_ELYCH|nr:hypothetical protein EGW08_001841 [Elysia chlorotica]